MKRQYLYLTALSLIVLVISGCSKSNPTAPTIGPNLGSGQVFSALADAASSLKGYWKLDGNLQEFTGTGNNGWYDEQPYNPNPIPTYVTGVRGQAIDLSSAGALDGGYMVVNTPSGLPFGEEFSVSLWIYPRQISGMPSGSYYPIVCQKTQYSRINFMLRLETDGSLTMNNGTVNCTSSQKVPFNSWTHVSCKYENGGMYIFINGVNVKSRLPAPIDMDNMGGSILFGTDGYYFYNGRMDEIQIHNVALSTPQVAGLYRKHKAVWALNGNAMDSTGNGSHGTNVNNKVTYVANGAGSAGVFNGSSYISLPAPNFNNMSAFTLTAWVNPQKYSTYNYILSKNTPDRDFAFNITSTGKLNVHFAITGVGYFDCTSTQSIPLNQWTHVAAIWTGNQWHLYINGSMVKTSAGTTYAPQWIGGKMAIGALGGGGAYFTGKIDDVTITDFILSPTQIYQIYNWGCGKF